MTDEQIERTAEATHEMNRLYCQAGGDMSQPTWGMATEWQRASARLGIVGALAGNTPEQQHEGWSAQKFKDGWVHGVVKDAVAKTHPCLVPYGELSEFQRRKDDLFLAVAKAFSAAIS